VTIVLNSLRVALQVVLKVTQGVGIKIFQIKGLANKVASFTCEFKQVLAHQLLRVAIEQNNQLVHILNRVQQLAPFIPQFELANTR